jgi:hypothetical protein
LKRFGSFTAKQRYPEHLRHTRFSDDLLPDRILIEAILALSKSRSIRA